MTPQSFPLNNLNPHVRLDNDLSGLVPGPLDYRSSFFRKVILKVWDPGELINLCRWVERDILKQ